MINLKKKRIDVEELYFFIYTSIKYIRININYNFCKIRHNHIYIMALLYIISRLYVGVMKYHNLLFQQPSILCTSRIRKCLSTAATCSYMHCVQLIVVILKTQTARLR